MPNTTFPKEEIIKLIIQFMRENNLDQSLSTLEKESSQSLNTVENKSKFLQDIKDGRWDIVLKQVNHLGIPHEKLFGLYEQITLELIEDGEDNTAEALLRSSNVLRFLSEEYPDRYIQLEKYLEERPTKPRYKLLERRANIARELEDEVSVVPNSRLLTLLGQSLKWQQHQGTVLPGSSYDLFRGSVSVQKAEEDAFPSKLYVQIKFPGKKTYAEAAAFSKNGQYLATGTVDGFIEIWNHLTGKIRKDLKYQAEDSLMAIDESVLCVQFSQDNELLACGSSKGIITIWKVKTGQCQKNLVAAHTEGVTCICFSRDGTQVLSGSYDQTIRIHGLKSGRMLKELRGHTSFINSAVYSLDNTRVLSASSDGNVKIWDSKLATCLYTINPQPKIGKDQLNPMGGLGNASVQNIIQLPKSANQFLVCNKTNTLFIMSSNGQIVKTFSHNKQAGSDFTCATVSPKGDFIYAITEDSYLYGFRYSTGSQIGKVKVCENEVIGLTSHPLSNCAVAYDDTGYVYFFKAP